jgi:hypothetical protein
VSAERSLGLAAIGIDGAGDHEVGLGGHGQSALGRDHRDPTAAERPGERQFRQSLRQGHHGGDGHRGRATDEDVHPQRLAATDRRRMMHADPAVDLIVQPDLASRLVGVAGELDPVHPQVRAAQAGPVGILGIDLGQGDERSAVHRPALDPGQFADAGPVRQDRPRPRSPRQEPPERARHAAVSPGIAAQGAGIGLELDQPTDRVERVPEQEPRAFERAEEVAQHRERGPLRVPEQQCRPPGLVDPPLDGGDLQVRIDFPVDDDELPGRFQVPDAFYQRTIAHQADPSTPGRFDTVTITMAERVSRGSGRLPSEVSQDGQPPKTRGSGHHQVRPGTPGAVGATGSNLI